MHQGMRTPDRGRGPVRAVSSISVFSALVVVGTVASAEPWLRASSSVSETAITVVLRNNSSSHLHALDPKRWGLNNYVKVGTEVRPLWAAHDPGSSSEERPDLDGVMAYIEWARIELGPDGLAPGASVSVNIPRPGSLHGQVDVVVLARKRGSDWLTLRETVATQTVVSGDGWRVLAGAGLLVAGLIFARWTRRPRLSRQ